MLRFLFLKYIFFLKVTLHLGNKYTDLNLKKIQVGNDQEKAQSEKDSHSKNRGGKKLNLQSGTYTMKTYRKHFPDRWPLS